MLKCPSDIFSSTTVILLGHFFTLKHCFPLLYFQIIILVVEEISRNKSVVQTPITYFINQKEKNMSIRHNSILTLMKSWATFFCIDIMYMVYLDVQYFSVVCISIYCEKLAVKTTFTLIGHLLQ